MQIDDLPPLRDVPTARLHRRGASLFAAVPPLRGLDPPRRLRALLRLGPGAPREYWLRLDARDGDPDGAAGARQVRPAVPPGPAVRGVVRRGPRRLQPVPPPGVVRRGALPLALRGGDARAPLALVLALVQELRPARRQGAEQPPLRPISCKYTCEFEFNNNY